MPQQPTSYISSLTPLRGIAAVWVVVFHVDEILGFAGLQHLLPREATGLLARGYLWVDFFFVLSGFIICHVYGARFTSGFSGRRLRAYLVARFSRLYPLHLFSLAAVAATYGVIVGFVPERLIPPVFAALHAPEALPYHFLLAHAMGFLDILTWNVPSWSISAEWWTYLAALLLFPLLNTGKRLTAWLTIAGALAALQGLVHYGPTGNLNVTYDLGFLRCLFEFAVGIGVYQLFKGRSGHWLRHDAAFAAVALLVLALLHSRLPDLLLVPAFSLLVLAAAYNEGRAQALLNARPLRWLGDVSYSVYMMQGIWLISFWIALQAASAGDLPLAVTPPVAYLFLIAVVAAVLATAAFTYPHVEVRCRRWLRRALGPAPDSTPPQGPRRPASRTRSSHSVPADWKRGEVL